MYRNIILSTACLFAAASITTHADEMDVGSATHKGHFAGIEDGIFKLQTSDGKMIKAPYAEVKSLKLDKNRRARMERSGKSQEDSVEVVSYKKPQITYIKDGRKSRLFASRIEKLTILDLPMSGGGMGGGMPGGIAAPQIVTVDVSGLENDPNLTPAQQSALQEYKTARARYDAYVAESSALVARMDSLQGAAREDVLRQLHHRKNQEQPLKNAYNAALNGLTAAFPELR